MANQGIDFSKVTDVWFNGNLVLSLNLNGVHVWGKETVTTTSIASTAAGTAVTTTWGTARATSRTTSKNTIIGYDGKSGAAIYASTSYATVWTTAWNTSRATTKSTNVNTTYSASHWEYSYASYTY